VRQGVRPPSETGSGPWFGRRLAEGGGLNLQRERESEVAFAANAPSLLTPSNPALGVLRLVSRVILRSGTFPVRS